MPRKPRPPRPLPNLSQPPQPLTGQAATFQSALDQQIVQTLGALPLLLPVFERLGLRQIVNRHVPPSAAEHDPGLVALMLCLNRLLAPRPLVHVETWLDTTVLPQMLRVNAEQFNDDRLARTLDALAPHLEAIWQDLVIQAIISFDLDLSKLCYDITSICFTGSYEQAELIRYGYSRDHRPDLQQLELALNVTSEGGVPIEYRVLAGNVADSTTPVQNLTRLRDLLSRLPQVDPTRPPVAPLLISDRAMLTIQSMFEHNQHKLHFLGPFDGGQAGRELLQGVQNSELAEHPLEYRPQRAKHDQSWQPYQGVLRNLQVSAPDDSEQVMHLQVLVVYSPAKAKLDAQLRQNNLERLEASLKDLGGKLNHRPYTKQETVQRRLAQLFKRHPARHFLELSLEGKDGELSLNFERREEKINEAAKVDGRYLLVTNDENLTDEQMLRLSKRRDVPQKRFSTVKGPLQVRPVYVHKQERVLGLVFCSLVALLVFALIELECRRASKERTASTVIAEFSSLAVVITRFSDGTTLRSLSGLTPNQLALLEALSLPPIQIYSIPSG